jgi:hypothetical protein
VSDDYWNWVASRRAFDNPRGDFIRDTRDLLRLGKNPGSQRMMSAEAREEYERLKRQYEREVRR